MTLKTTPPIQMFNIGLPAKPASKTDYPTLPDPTGELAAIGAQVVLNKELIEAAEGAYEAGRGKLLKAATPFYFQVCHGRQDPPSSVVLDTSEGEVRLTFADAYKAVTDPKDVVAVVGNSIAATHFHQAWEFKVNGSQLPATPETQALLEEVVAVFAKHNASHAITFKSGIKPKKGFAAIRHTILSVTQNLQLNNLIPITASCNTKGRVHAHS